jgi:hypothetical protein
MANNDLNFDSNEIDQGINGNHNKIYKKDKKTTFCFINEANKKKDNPKNLKYFVNINRDKEQYIGILTDNFKRDLFGYSLLNNGDEYFGEISNEKKDGFGIYIFKMQNNDQQNIYIGHFSNDKIQGEGIYINALKTANIKINNQDAIELIKYNCYAGQFENGILKTGNFYTYNKDDDFEKLLIPNGDDKAFIIETHKTDNLVSKGTMKNGKIINGIMINITKSGDKMINKFYFKTGDESKYEFENLENPENEKEIIREYEIYKENYFKYNKTAQKCVDKIFTLIKNHKRNIQYANSVEVEKNFKRLMIDNYYNILLIQSK